MSVTLMIGGDVLPTTANMETFFQGRAEALLTDGLYEAWMAGDGRVFNLECPLTEGNTPIEKCGPALKAPMRAASGVGALKPDGVSLGNNHILDFGPEGLRSTVDALKKQGIPAFGAGENLAAADRPLYMDRNGYRIGMYALAEHEFSAAEENRAGANPLDLLELSDRIRSVKADCDYLILLYHGGRECYPYPSPMLQRTCRKAVESGADLVLCQHSHCIGCGETYKEATIVYGQGNFIFQVKDGEPCFDTGLILKIHLSDEGTQIAYMPIGQKNGGAALLTGAEGAAVLEGFHARSREIMEPGFVEKQYAQYAASYREKMLKVFLSGNPLLKGVNLLYGRKPSRVYGRQTLRNIQNTIACESLNELIRKGLE